MRLVIPTAESGVPPPPRGWAILLLLEDLPASGPESCVRDGLPRIHLALGPEGKGPKALDASEGSAGLTKDE